MATTSLFSPTKIYLIINPKIIGNITNNIVIKTILLTPGDICSYAVIGPINPANPKPALIDVPWILKMAPKAPIIPELIITGINNFGLSNIFPIWILGVPIKWASIVPKLLTELPIIANVKAPAVIPRLAEPDVINVAVTIVFAVIIASIIGNKLKNYTILLMPVLVLVIAGGLGLLTLPYVKLVTGFIGDTIKTANDIPINVPIKTGWRIVKVFIIAPIKPVTNLT